MDVQDLGDILGWCMWFAALGFFLLISELAKDRFEYVSQVIRGRHRQQVVASRTGLYATDKVILVVHTRGRVV